MEVLSGKFALARHLLERTQLQQLQRSVKEQLDDALTGHHGLTVAVFASDRRRLYANIDMPIPSDLISPPLTGGSNRPVKWRTNEGIPWRGISASIPMTGPSREKLIVVVGTEISHHEHFLQSFRITLWIFVACATAAMGLLGWVVVRRGLSPLRKIRDEATTITANRLHTRLPVEAVPEELGSVAGALNDMLSRLEDSFRRLSDFSSDLAHELRTPVSNLLTQTQVTLCRARTADEYREILESNAEEFERLSRTISDMLFLAKADNHQIIPNKELVDLGAEVQSLLEFYEVLAAEKSIVLSQYGHGETQGDRLMLRRAINNLLSNAMRHTPPGGNIFVSVGRGTDEYIELTVANTGTTIPAEHLPRLFDRFYRADSSRQRSCEGSGLGLAITRSILAAHGGTISVISADGLTRFVLRLPEDSMKDQSTLELFRKSEQSAHQDH